MPNKYIVITLFIFCSFFSCSKKKEIDQKKIFKLNRHDNISSLDPINARTQANNWACNLIFNSLVKINNNLDIEPEIAKSWTISTDGKTYLFNLRNDVFFHKHEYFGKDSTRLVNANDFVFSFNRLKDPNIGGSGSWIMQNVASYQAINDTVLKIELKKPSPSFLGLISMKYASVVPKELFKNDKNDFFKQPIGTGPFQFKIWDDNVKMVLRRNPNYFEFDQNGKRLPYLEAVNFSFLPEKNSEFLELIKGNLDMMSDLDPSYKDEILDPLGNLNSKYSSFLKLYKIPYLSTVYLSFYLDGQNPIDIKLRRALNYGIDKDKIVKYIMKNQGFAANAGIIPKGLPGHSTKNYFAYSPEMARKLIDDYKNTHKLLPPIELTTVQEYLDVCEYIVAEMGKLGLSMTVNVVPSSTMREGKATGKFTLFRANWSADYPDAENFLSLFFSKNFSPDGPNYSHYKNIEFDNLYEQSFLVGNIEKRSKIYVQMDQLLMNDAPILPLFYDQTTLFLNKNVQNLSMGPIKLLDLTRVYKE